LILRTFKNETSTLGDPNGEVTLQSIN